MNRVGLELLSHPFEQVDAWLATMIEGSPPLAALCLALVLGLRHASDPDHLVAVTSLVAADGAGARQARRLGAWWGLGHALTLVALGLPLILLKSSLPTWLEKGAERAVGAVILVLAAWVMWKWIRGDYRAAAHRHGHAADVLTGSRHRHLHRGEGADHGHRSVRTPRQALAIGVLHGLAGTGAVVVVLIAALRTPAEAAAALAVFAPMSIVSMAAITGGWAWLLTRRTIEPLYRGVLIPALGVFGIFFGLWYAGLG